PRYAKCRGGGKQLLAPQVIQNTGCVAYCRIMSFSTKTWYAQCRSSRKGPRSGGSAGVLEGDRLIPEPGRPDRPAVGKDGGAAGIPPPTFQTGQRVRLPRRTGHLVGKPESNSQRGTCFDNYPCSAGHRGRTR